MTSLSFSNSFSFLFFRLLIQFISRTDTNIMNKKIKMVQTNLLFFFIYSLRFFVLFSLMLSLFIFILLSSSHSLIVAVEDFLNRTYYERTQHIAYIPEALKAHRAHTINEFIYFVFFFFLLLIINNCVYKIF